MPTRRPTTLTRAAAARWLLAGEVVCREGDPPGPLYIILAGRVRVFRVDAAQPARTLQLAVLGAGDVIGELAPILDRPRSATVQAIEPTQVLEIPLDQLSPVIRDQAPLQRVIGLALKERAGLTLERLAAVTARLGIQSPIDVDVEAPAPGAGVSSRGLPAPEHDRRVTYTKSVECPACATSFSALVANTRMSQLGERASDFHQRYRSALNPYDYEVWVCPNDLYAAFPADFAELRPVHAERLPETIVQLVAEWTDGRPDFNVDRNLNLREKSLLLALAAYRVREAGPLRLAAVMHRLAWCARERDDLAGEQRSLRQALEAYTAAYQQSDLGEAKEELRILYLCGELSVRVDDIDAGMTWLAQGLRHDALKHHPSWDRLFRERWSDLRSSAQVATEPNES